jgi:hypothetical protein
LSRTRLAVLACATVASAVLASGAPARAQGPAPQTAPAPARPASGPSGGLSFDVGVLSKAPAGAWADYAMTPTTPTPTTKAMTIRYSLVERTPKKMALEIDTPTPKGDVVVHFDLVPVDHDTWKLVGGRMKRGDDMADMSKDEIAAAPAMKAGAQPGPLVGTESITVPAGTFPCKHYRNKLTAEDNGPVLDVWVSDAVAPTGLVKSMLSPAGITMQLAAVGTGAPSKVK